MLRHVLPLALIVACSPPGEDAEDSKDDTDTRGPGCQHAGFDEVPFDDSATEIAFDALLPDVRLKTLEGVWKLSEAWGDCETFTLVPYGPDFERHDIEALVTDSEPNNTYLFFSFGPDPKEDMARLKDAVDAYLDSRRSGFRERWAPKFRYVTQQASKSDLLDAMGRIQTDYYLIDARQRLRDAGSLSTYNGDFVPELSMGRYASRWFAYEHRMDNRLAAEADDDNVLVVPWITEGYDQTDEGRFKIELPDAETLARFDRVEIMIRETCEPGTRFPIHVGVCPAWDVGHKISICDDLESCVSNEKRQIHRYVTAYHGGGVWMEDVTHALPWLRTGGTKWMRTDRGDFWGQISLHFYDDGEVAPEDHLADAEHLIDMGRAQWDAAHNDSFPSYRFTPPPGTVRVVMDARVQGGGNNAPSGCAEFCSHSHSIDVNGTTWDTTFEMKQGEPDCANRAGEGVTSGQFGTWFLDRGSWCPGGPVERWQEDITEAVNLDGANDIVWSGNYNGDTWPPGGGTTATVWLKFYGADGEALVERQPVETCDNPPTVVIRDLERSHPDFAPLNDAWRALEDGDAAKDGGRGVKTGVVASTLGVDGKPVFVWPEDTLPFTTKANFDSWWKDGPDTRTVQPAADSFRRTRQGTFGYFRSNAEYAAEFPLIAADAGFGAEDQAHGHEGGTPVNSAFTVQISGSFEHRDGLRLRLASRSDIWVFLDDELVHESAGFLGKGFPKDILALDDLDLVDGDTYDLKIFAVGGRDGGSNPQMWLEHPACD